MTNWHRSFIFFHTICVYYILTDIIDVDINVSYKQCLQKCKNWRECKSMYYMTQFKMCKYADVHYSSCDYVSESCDAEKIGKHYNKPENWNNVGSEKEIKVCPSPPEKPDAHLLGNMRKIGSKVKYVCNEDETKWEILKCEENGYWTQLSLVCNLPCSAPPEVAHSNKSWIGLEVTYFCDRNHTQRETIKCLSNGTWTQSSLICPVACPDPIFNDTYQNLVRIIEMTVWNITTRRVHLNCSEPGYVIRPSYLFCNINDGVWIDQEFVCCTKMVRIGQDPRYLVYKVMSRTNGTKVVQWNGSESWMAGEIGERCFYRNTDFWLDWRSWNPVIVRFLITRENGEIIRLNFQNIADNEHWFSQTFVSAGEGMDWSFLNSTEQNVHLSINKTWIGSFIKVTIATSETDNTCSMTGWLDTISNNGFCEDASGPVSGIHTVYSNQSTEAHLGRINETSIAEDFEIWVRTDHFDVS